MASTTDMEYVEYENHGGVGVWTISDFAAYFDSDEIERGEAHYRERASDNAMDATVVVIQNASELGSEIRNSLDHINEEWSALADAVGIDRLAYVADGMMASTVKMKIEADVAVESFDSVEEAVDWAQG